MIRGNVQVFLATAAVDMRKSFDTLAEHVRVFLGHDPLSGSMFVFRSRSAERVKILWWDHNGLAIYYKRLEKGTFQFPPPGIIGGQTSVSISSAQLLRLLEGMEVAVPAAYGAAVLGGESQRP